MNVKEFTEAFHLERECPQISFRMAVKALRKKGLKTTAVFLPYSAFTSFVGHRDGFGGFSQMAVDGIPIVWWRGIEEISFLVTPVGESDERHSQDHAPKTDRKFPNRKRKAVPA